LISPFNLSRTSDLRPPKTATVYQTPTATYWIEGDVLYLNAKSADITLEQRLADIEKLKEILDGQRLCAIMDFKNASPASADVRQATSTELPQLFRAIGFIVRNPASKMLATIFIAKRLPIPVEFFKNEHQALAWIIQYMN
jgi:hypothetical protein